MDLVAPVVLVGVVLGLVQVVKLAGMDSRFAPILSIVLGIAVEALASPLPFNARQMVLTGLAIGLSAAGLYSGTKTVISSGPTTPTV
jgi:hypothetical protein